jgi:GT2 family glycosyltransferase
MQRETAVSRISIGNVIAFTDADCVPDRSWISSGVRALQQAVLPVIVGGPIVFSFRQPRSRTTCELLDSIVHHRQAEYVSVHGFAATANLFARRELISAFGQFDERYFSGGDREFGQRLGAAGVGLAFEQDAIVVHPARASFLDLLRKNLRGAGGDKTSMDARGHSSAFALPCLQIRNYLYRQRLISHWARSAAAGTWLQIRLRALLTLIYALRVLEAIRLALGGLPRRS